MARRLPQGRGAVVGVNAQTSNNDSYLFRRGLNYKTSTFGVFPIPQVLTASALTANALRIMYWGSPKTEVQLDWAKMRVTTLSAGQTFYGCIYVFDSKTRSLKQVIGSKVTVDCTTTGQKILPVNVQLYPDLDYWIGGYCTSATPAFGCWVHTVTNQAISSALVKAGMTRLPEQLTAKELTQLSTGTVPAIYYVSKTAVDFM